MDYESHLSIALGHHGRMVAAAEAAAAAARAEAEALDPDHQWAEHDAARLRAREAEDVVKLAQQAGARLREAVGLPPGSYPR